METKYKQDIFIQKIIQLKSPLQRFKCIVQRMHVSFCLSSRKSGFQRDIVVLNAAAGIFVGGEAELKEGVNLATERLIRICFYNIKSHIMNILTK